ncbi:rhodanese-like domain-containing protein [Paenibacillus antri]|uniref:Rhodanese-like domain-containing protein n=1 Tax=Paenibacillus antri TaxID=2582848 RepID=A0A5R9G0Y5_9BACL|nr:rhodanese-like domain-containing protein [Paenibacillus antri]TLS49982.1 rhodanese-like domain-containing protein [Paenibacillus antri]
MAGKYSKDMLPQEVKERLAKGEKLNILDVREPEEWESGHIPNAKHLPLGSIGQRLSELDPTQSYIIVCRGGNRSGLACELLEELGYDVTNMPGGMSHWQGEVAYGI